MIEACGSPPEPDLILEVSPPVPRRCPGALVPPPVPPAPPPVPPAEPAEPDVEAAAAPVVEQGDAVHPGGWPDRRWWASTATSTVVHVVVLTLLALVVTRPDDLLRPRPIEISRPSEDLEPVPFLDPAEQLAVEVLEPVADDAVEEAVLVEADPADAMDAAFEASDDPVAGVIELDQAGLPMKVGGGAGGGEGTGGFGGEVGRRLALAGAKTGDVQVSLSWENFNDIDLHVVTPAGERIWYGHRRSKCGGTLDVDMNAGGPATREPVENVFWPKGAAPTGEYQVFVHHFARHDKVADETAFDVHVLVNGVRRRFTGYVKSGDPPKAVTRFVKAAGADSDGYDEFVE